MGKCAACACRRHESPRHRYAYRYRHGADNPVSLSDGTLPFTDQDKDDTHQAFVQGASAQWTSGAGAAVTTAIPAETANALGTALTVGIAAESGEGPGTVSWSFALAQSLSRFLGAGEHLAVTYTISGVRR